MAGAATREGAYVASTDVSVVVGPAGKRRLINKGQAIPASVAITEVRMLVSVGLVAYVGSEQLGAVAAANPLEVPAKSASKGEWESYAVTAGLLSAEEASRKTKAKIIADVEAHDAPPTPPAGDGKGSDDQVPPVPPVDPDAPPVDPENPADPVNPGDAGGSEGQV